MAWKLEATEFGNKAIADAKNTNIRFQMVPFVAYAGDQNRGDLKWRTATTENVSQMSAIAYFFAQNLQQKLNVPIGIICCYKGGSGAESWTSRESLLKYPETATIVENYEKNFSKLSQENYLKAITDYEIALKAYNVSVKNGNNTQQKPREPMGDRNYNRPSGLYNTMLARVTPHTVKGVIWYQGEHNSSRAKQYKTLFPALIEQWRTDFKNPNMPFLFVQLSNFDNTGFTNPYWAELREAQLVTWQNVKNTGMTVSIDMGDKKSIHPICKEPIGKRLAANALNIVYGLNLPYSGPVFRQAKIDNDKITIQFDFVYDGLKSNGELQGFTICGSDKSFIPAKASIVNNKVEVWADSVKSPIAVRYGWANWTDANLQNAANFPATPFRTDNFELTSK
jgi:sialate O-acetylesterase